MISKWYQKTIQYWLATRSIGLPGPRVTLDRWKKGGLEAHYFWFHYLFGDLYEHDPEFRHSWNHAPKLSETKPHYLQTRGMLKKLSGDVKRHIDFKQAPLYKLTYRFNEKQYRRKSSLHYLLHPRLSHTNIASTDYEVSDAIPNIRFVHVGKCGGTSILTTFKDQGVKLHSYHLCKPRYSRKHKYIIWIRNPLHRFVSAFNFSSALVDLDTSSLDSNNLTIDNCLAPARVRHKMTHDHTFSTEYDELIRFFKTPNCLAESLTHHDSQTRDKAFQLMNHPLEHINKGLGWYLDNGEFVKKYRRKILFVGRMEAMKPDLDRLSSVLQVDLDAYKGKARVNTVKRPTSLSAVAVRNLQQYYKNTDYRAFEVLHQEGWIDAKTLQSFHRHGEHPRMTHTPVLEEHPVDRERRFPPVGPQITTLR